MKRILTIIVSIGLLYSCGATKGKLSKNQPAEQRTEVVGEEGEIIDNSEAEEVEEFIETPLVNAEATILTALKHTKVDMSFDRKKSQLKGLYSLTHSTHLYASDRLFLAAKAMEIKS